MLIGISGRAKNGKSTAANALVNHAEANGITAKSYEISNAILKVCQERGLIAPGKVRAQLTPEEVGILIQVGTEGREKDPYFWVNQIDEEIWADKDVDLAIIPNIRSADEATYIREAHGHLIRVTALNPDGTPFIATDRDPNNPLETIAQTLVPDFHITAQRGESVLVSEYAITLFEYLRALEAK